MSESSFSDYFNEFETPRSQNGAISRPKATAQHDPPRDREEEITLEGWCRNGKISRTLLEENNASLSDDSWIAEEDHTRAFKNALAVLSDGLALMHKKGQANRVTPEVEKSQVRNTKPKTKTVPPLRRKTVQLPKARASVGCQDKGKISLADITQDNDQLPPLIKIKEASNSSRASLHLPSLELKLNPHDSLSQDLVMSIQDTSSHAVIKGLEDNVARTCCEIEAEKIVLPDQFPKTWNNLDNDQSKRFETPKEAVAYEYVLKPIKPTVLNPVSAPLSQKSIDRLIAPKPNPLFYKNYNPPPKEFKQANPFRIGVLNCSDDAKINRSFLPSKRTLSPANTLIFPDSSKSSKFDAATAMPPLKTQKAVLQNKETPNNSVHLKFEGFRLNGASKSKENDANAYKIIPLSKKQSETGVQEEQGSKGNLRSILGQVLDDNRDTSHYNLNLKEAHEQTENQMPECNDPNVKKSIDYFLSLYKLGAEKVLEKPKLVDQSLTGGSKVTDFLKKLTEIQPKTKQFSQLESLNNSLFGKDKSFKPKDLGQRLSVKSNQSRNEVVFRLRKMKANYDNKLSIL